jgi:hypothetical protein
LYCTPVTPAPTLPAHAIRGNLELNFVTNAIQSLLCLGRFCGNSPSFGVSVGHRWRETPLEKGSPRRARCGPAQPSRESLEMSITSRSLAHQSAQNNPPIQSSVALHSPAMTSPPERLAISAEIRGSTAFRMNRADPSPRSITIPVPSGGSDQRTERMRRTARYPVV